jgi:hypothetical protein
MQTQSVLRAYFNAKDGNQPQLMREVFGEDALLTFHVKAPGVFFPEVSRGRAAIAEVLVGRFGETYANVRSFYLDWPAARVTEFSCDWLVGMTQRADGEVRVGCGRYDWRFQSAAPGLANELRITIECMQRLPAGELSAILAWLGKLEYPFTSARAVAAEAPALPALAPVLRYLGRDAR